MSEEVLSDFIAENIDLELRKENEKKFDELQVFLHESLTKVISQALDADELYDPFTVISFMGEILKVYYEKCQTRFSEVIDEKSDEMRKVVKEA